MSRDVELPQTDRAELLALSVLVALFERLDAGERRRAIAYLADRFDASWRAAAPAGWYVERDGTQQPVAELILQRDTLGEALANANGIIERLGSAEQQASNSLGKVREQLMVALRERDAEREHVEKLREQAATARRERDEAREVLRRIDSGEVKPST